MLFGFGFSPSKPRKAGGITYDADAQAFFTATGITDATQKSAVNQLVLDLKSYNIWTKMKAVYPFVGGTSTTHKYNLKDPQDTNGAFRLSFSTGWTHSSTGATPNGSSAFANTFLNPNTVLSSSNNHLSIYLRTNVSANTVDFGSYSISGLTYYLLIYPRSSGNLITIANGNTAFPNAANADSTGLFLMSKTDASNATAYRNNIKLINNQPVGTGITTQNMYLGASNNNGTAGTFSGRQIAFASLGQSFNDTEAGNFFTAIDTFQTTLGRKL
jgi:hypothetical protein